MNITPTWIDEPRQQDLVRETGSPEAPLWIQRLFAFCQQQRQWEFPAMKPKTLAHVCRWDSKRDCAKLLLKLGYIEPLLGGGFRILDFPKLNEKLIGKWESGPKGGRPRNDSPELRQCANSSESVEHPKPTQPNLTQPNRTELNPSLPSPLPSEGVSVAGKVSWTGRQEEVIDAMKREGVAEHADKVFRYLRTHGEVDRKKEPISDLLLFAVRYGQACAKGKIA